MIAFALWKHGVHNGDFAKIKEELRNMPDFRLSDQQADQILDNLRQFLVRESDVTAPSRLEAAPGQVWRYQTRDGETASRATVLKIDWMGDEQIIHIALNNLKINTPNRNKTMSEVGHLPVSKLAFQKSVTTLETQLQEIEIPEGYYQWKEVYDHGKAGVFDTSFAEIVYFIEQSMQNQQ